MEEILFITDIEFSIVVFAFIVLIIFSLRKRRADGSCRFFIENYKHSKDFSMLVKGMACVMILLSHYSARVLGGGLPKGVTYYVTIYAANLALIFFMFYSGYGISLANANTQGGLRSAWVTRLRKVYFPLLFVCVINTLFFIIPNDGITGWGKMLYVIGWADEWYVICIIYFYSIYYFSLFLSRKLQISESLILSVLLLVYFIMAYLLCGELKAHFYRYPCAFMIGHLVAMRHRNSKKESWGILLVFLLTLIPCGIHYIKSYILAFTCLYIVGLIQQRTCVKTNSILYGLGSISYFFYLTHERIAWKFLEFVGIHSYFHSCLLWIGITLCLAIFLKFIYNLLIVKVFS